MEGGRDIFQSLPIELQSHILHFVGDPKATAALSKDWEKASKAAFQNIFISYEQSPILREYTGIVKDQETGYEHDRTKVKEVYQTLIQKASQFGIAKPKNLSLSEMEKIASEVRKQEAVQFISFFDKSTESIPEARPFLEHLADLSDEDKASQLKEWMRENQSLLLRVTKLDLTGGGPGPRGLKFLPEEISYFSNLESLNLSHNHLQTLPDSIGNLPKLEELELNQNRLYKLPESIGNLQNLEILNLDRNHLQILPESIGDLQNLQGLEIEYNRLSSLPESIGNLRNLRGLDIKGNQLNSLPDSMIRLLNLESIHIQENKFKPVPKPLEDLKLQNPNLSIK